MPALPALLFWPVVLISIYFAAAPLAACQEPAKPIPPPSTVPEMPLEPVDRRDSARAPKVALFFAEGFPAVDAPAISEATLGVALRRFKVDTLRSSEDVKNKLKNLDYDVFVLPYGSAFPLGAWTTIKGFLERGGGLVVFGGAPFHHPVRFEAKTEVGPPSSTPGVASRSAGVAGTWVLGSRQPTFARDLLIGPAEAVRVPAKDRITPLVPCGWSESGPRPSTVWELTTRLSTKKDFDKEDGSAGPRDAVLRPMVHILDATGTPLACPLLTIDRLRGSEGGARWVLAPSDAVLTDETIERCVAWALAGAMELDARPVHASIDMGETARVRIALRLPWLRKDEPVPTRVRVKGRGPDGHLTLEHDGRVILTGTPEQQFGDLTIANLTRPGLYEIEVDLLETAHPVARTTTGFWVRDDKLLTGGPVLSVSRDWIRKDGKVFPIVGTTYMASDVHRKFLFEPNPAVWDRDFAQMKANGVNFVRTGLWTGWQRAMLDAGAFDEGVLRALDAYVMTAAHHGIVVCFNFFAFLPPAYGGTNPYLDARALDGQKAFLASVARRYRGCGWIHYDLINEPSYCPPDQLWQNRPIGDEQEKRAWTEWTRARHGSDQVKIRDAWHDPMGELLSMPKVEEFTYSMTRETRRPRKVADFHRFTNDVVSAWAGELRQALRQAGGDVLVTLGQDEGGTWLRPTQQIYGESVDYTAVHTWWNNDDLLWDGILTKLPEKPNLIQETGLMRLEDVDGFPWRSPEDAAKLLERKFALAFASRGCGAVQWAWNINPVMPVENESVIGIFRPDGTAKPELRVLREFGKFFEAAAPYLDDFDPDPVVVVLPNSRLFAGRPQGLDGTKQIVRTLSDFWGVAPTAISEMRLTPERLKGVKLVIVPSAEMLEPAAATALDQASRAGTKILFLGSVEGDPYGKSVKALTDLGVEHKSRNLSLREPTRWTVDGQPGFVTFDGGRSEWLRAAATPPLTVLEGNVWHEPLPLEFARETSALRELLGAALTESGVDKFPCDFPATIRILNTRNHALAIGVNDSPVEVARGLDIGTHRSGLRIPPGVSQLLLIDRASGEVVAKL